VSDVKEFENWGCAAVNIKAARQITYQRETTFKAILYPLKRLIEPVSRNPTLILFSGIRCRLKQ
jgi:hypothetical protein